MSNFCLTPDEVTRLWSMQPTGPFARWAKWVLGNMWVPPMLLLLPLLFAKFEKTSIVISLIAAVVYLAYGFITARVCAPWRQRRKLWIRKSTLSLILLSGYNAISLVFISLIMLTVSLLTGKGKTFFNIDLGISIISLYIVILLVSIISAPYIIRRRIITYQNPTSKTYQIPVVLAGAPGIGMIVARIFMNTPYIIPIMIVINAFAGFILLPFGALKIYETVVLWLNWENAA